MKTPSLRMIRAGCFGPDICHTRAIWFFKEVKRTATARPRKTNLSCDRRFRDRLRRRCSMQTCFRPTYPHSAGGVCTSSRSTGPYCHPAAWRWPQFAAGPDIVIDYRNRSDGLEKVRLAPSEMDTREPEPTRTDVTDQHG